MYTKYILLNQNQIIPVAEALTQIQSSKIIMCTFKLGIFVLFKILELYTLLTILCSFLPYMNIRSTFIYSFDFM